MDRFDLVVVGGGIIGSSVAMALSECGVKNIAVVDVDLEGRFSSTERNAGGVRATWWEEVNVRLSLESIRFFESIADQVGFRKAGYVWLQDRKRRAGMAERIRSLERYHLGIEVLSVPQLQTRFPFLDRTEGLEGAIFCPNDGLINPNLLKLYYRNRAQRRGVRFMDHLWVERVRIQNGRIEAVECRVLDAANTETVEALLVRQTLPPSETVRVLTCERFVNAAGAWAAPLARLYGRRLPSVPVRRQISVFHSTDLDLSPFGMIVDSTGLYFHPEGGNILAGYSNPEEPEGYNFQFSGPDFFNEEIWPRLYARSTRFERLKYVSGWAGLYERSPDGSGIVGPVQGFSNAYEAHSFSGHGVMQSYAVGQALAEGIVKGRYEPFDVSSLRGDRFARGRNVFEELFI